MKIDNITTNDSHNTSILSCIANTEQSSLSLSPLSLCTYRYTFYIYCFYYYTNCGGDNSKLSANTSSSATFWAQLIYTHYTHYFFPLSYSHSHSLSSRFPHSLSLSLYESKTQFLAHKSLVQPNYSAEKTIITFL